MAFKIEDQFAKNAAEELKKTLGRKKVPRSVGAAAFNDEKMETSETTGHEDEGKDESEISKEQADFNDEIEGVFYDVFNPEGINEKIFAKYASEKTIKELQQRVETLKEKLLAKATTEGWFKRKFDEGELKREVKAACYAENEKSNAGKGMAHFREIIAEACQEPAKKEEMVEEKVEEKKEEGKPVEKEISGSEIAEKDLDLKQIKTKEAMLGYLEVLAAKYESLKYQDGQQKGLDKFSKIISDVKNAFGTGDWRSINPTSIRYKAKEILEADKAEKPKETKPEKPEKVMQEIKEADLSGMENIQGREELLEYLKQLGEVAVRAKDGYVCFFPAYIQDVKKAFDQKLNWEDIHIVSLRSKIKEIIRKDQKTEEAAPEAKNEVKGAENQLESQDFKVFEEESAKVLVKLEKRLAEAGIFEGYTVKRKNEALRTKIGVMLETKFKEKFPALAPEKAEENVESILNKLFGA